MFVYILIMISIGISADAISDTINIQSFEDSIIIGTKIQEKMIVVEKTHIQWSILEW